LKLNERPPPPEKGDVEKQESKDKRFEGQALLIARQYAKSESSPKIKRKDCGEGEDQDSSWGNSKRSRAYKKEKVHGNIRERLWRGRVELLVPEQKSSGKNGTWGGPKRDRRRGKTFRHFEGETNLTGKINSFAET